MEKQTKPKNKSKIKKTKQINTIIFRIQKYEQIIMIMHIFMMML